MKATSTTNQMNFAIWQSKNRCCIVSLELQKQHLALPFHFLLIKLSLVNVTPFFRNHKKILIFNGTFIFQDLQKDGVASLVMMFVYTFLFGIQQKVSLSLVKVTFVALLTSCSQRVSLLPTKVLLKETLRGIDLRAVPIQTPLIESKPQRLHHKKLYFPMQSVLL